ncbi:translation protein SH3-like domain-containing protein [Lyophyllum atratum]|nr:translation protein SH3-like domain-containing protein [Lyophyllum atratum]
MADVETTLQPTNEGGDSIVDDGEEAESKEIMLMKQRVAEMEKEAKKLRELQAAAEEASNAAEGEDGVPMETEEDKTQADTRSVYVGNVDYSATPEEIQVHFQACGTINRVTILCDKFTGHPRGYAYVEFAEPEHIDAAVAMDNSLFRGRLIKPTPCVRAKASCKHLQKSIPTPAKQEMFRTLFSRHSPNQILPGSILQLTLEHAPATFTGVLMGIRRRGLDTSILLRNIIQRTGVEMQFFVNSPHVKDIKVLQKPPGGRMRRAKLFYLRDSPEKMSMIAGGRK